MIARFSQGIYSAYFPVRAVRTDVVQLTVGFFGKHNAGSRIQQGEPHGNAAAVGAGIGVPVSAFQKDHFNGSGVFFHKLFSPFKDCFLLFSGDGQRWLLNHIQAKSIYAIIHHKIRLSIKYTPALG